MVLRRPSTVPGARIRFGPEFSKTLGVGTRDGDTITFVFDYPNAPFKVRYTWNSADQVWTINITFKDSRAPRKPSLRSD